MMFIIIEPSRATMSCQGNGVSDSYTCRSLGGAEDYINSGGARAGLFSYYIRVSWLFSNDV